MAKELKYQSLRDLPELAGWITFGEAAQDLELTGERIRQMAQEGQLTTAHKLGRRPIGVVRAEEIEKIIRERHERSNPPGHA